MPLGIDDVLASYEENCIDVLSLEEALEALRGRSTVQAEIVTMRFFGGMSAADIAACLQLTPAQVEAEWRLARAWLRVRLGEADEQR